MMKLNHSKPKPGSLEGNGMVMGFWLSEKSGLRFMQNCDLPPPVNVFAGPDKAVFSSTNRIYGMVDEEEDDSNDLGEPTSGTENGKLELLKALRLSQTRAREAEEKATVLTKERDSLRNAFMEDSSRLFAHRQWVKLLELQLAIIQRQQQQKQQRLFYRGCQQTDAFGGRSQNEEEDCHDRGTMSWFTALAVCLGIAGVGLAYGWGFFF